MVKCCCLIGMTKSLKIKNNHNEMKKTLLASTLVAVAGGSFAQKPNIVYIMTDQQTAEAMNCAGNEYVSTPNMDRLANDGVRFTNAYCSTPLSGPSRFAMFTGYSPGTHKMLQNNTPFPKAVDKDQTLGYLISEAGYNCAYGGKWHIPEASLPIDDEENNKGFGFTFLYEHNDFGLAESTIDYLKQDKSEPFFLVVSFDNPHNICEYARHQNLPFATIDEPADIETLPNLPPNFSPAPFEAEIVRVEQSKQTAFSLYPTAQYTVDEWRRYVNAYYRLVETVDKEIGKVLDALDEQGLYDNSVIIFASDHGDGVAANNWNQKTALFEEVVKVPFIVKGVKSTNRNVVREQLVNSGLDFFATICDYAEAKIPNFTSGKSVKAIVEESKTDENHPYIVTETEFSNSNTRGWMVRTPNYKYVLYDRGKYREQLFKINEDKLERRNLAVEKQFKPELNRHRAMLNEWIGKNKIFTTGREIIDADK